MRTKSFFVTGTDTEVGKTFVTAALLGLARERGLDCAGVKPVAAGCHRQEGRLVNDDALALIAASGADLDYPTVNPVALEPAIAPHIAAVRAGRILRVETLAERCREVLAADFDFVLVEGAGGWFVPLNDEQTLADLCIDLDLAVILVIGMRLGCLNHALLTAAAIAQAGLELAGWVGNSIGAEMPYLEENFATLHGRLDAPCLGLVPYLDSFEPRAAWRFLKVGPLLA